MRSGRRCGGPENPSRSRSRGAGSCRSGLCWRCPAHPRVDGEQLSARGRPLRLQPHQLLRHLGKGHPGLIGSRPRLSPEEVSEPIARSPQQGPQLPAEGQETAQELVPILRSNSWAFCSDGSGDGRAGRRPGRRDAREKAREGVVAGDPSYHI